MRDLLPVLMLIPALFTSAGNIEMNGNFTSPAGWQISTSGAWIKNNIMTLTRKANERGASAIQRLKVVPGKEYDVEFEAKTATSYSGAQLRVEFPPKWDDPGIFDLETNSLAWRPMKYRVKASGNTMQIFFWIKKGPTDTTLKIRRFCVRPAGDILPPAWRKPEAGYPWGWSIEGKKKSVLTNDVIPENPMHLTAAVLHGNSIRWRIEALDVNYNLCGTLQQGKMSKSKPLDHIFKVPDNTVYLRFIWESDDFFELGDVTCARIDN